MSLSYYSWRRRVLGSNKRLLPYGLFERDFFKVENICLAADYYWRQDISTHVDKLFVALAKDSGLFYYENYLYSFIDMDSLREPLRSELRQLFQLSDDTKQLKKEEFSRGIWEMTNSFIARSEKIQRLMNLVVQKLLRDMINSADDQYPADSTSIESAEASEEMSRKNSESADTALFRSNSIGADDFASKPRDCFKPDETTTQLFSTCFEDFFTECEGTQSRPAAEASDEIVYKYGQLYSFFATEAGVVTREKFITFIKNFAERKIVSSRECMATAAEYCLRKITKATTKLAELVAAQPSIYDYVAGSKVLFKPFNYPDPIPATVVSVTENAYGYKTWKVRLDFDVSGEEHDAYRTSLQPNPNVDVPPQENQAQVVAGPTPEEIAYEECLWSHHEHGLLSVLREQLGPTYAVTGDNGIPSLAPIDYYFWFNIPEEGKIKFYFEQFDYGVKFSAPGNVDRNFLPEHWFEGSSFPQAQIAESKCANEINRCFFLHLSRGLKINPFALCVAYRILARSVIAEGEEDDMCMDGARDVLAKNRFVDAFALASIWPEEFDDYQILIVNLDGDGHFNMHQGFTYICPPNSPRKNAAGEFTGRDIILTLQHGHFTYLSPTRIVLPRIPGESTEEYDARSSTGRDEYLAHPIQTLLLWAVRINLNVASVFDLFPDPFGTDRPRLSIRGTLESFLSSELPELPPVPVVRATTVVANPVETVTGIGSVVSNINNSSNLQNFEENINDMEVEQDLPSPQLPPPSSSLPGVVELQYRQGDRVKTSWGGEAVVELVGRNEATDALSYNVRYINNGDVECDLPLSFLEPADSPEPPPPSSSLSSNPSVRPRSPIG